MFFKKRKEERAKKLKKLEAEIKKTPYYIQTGVENGKKVFNVFKNKVFKFDGNCYRDSRFLFTAKSKKDAISLIKHYSKKDIQIKARDLK